MQAIILAAGMGKRLKDLTADNTKCMVKVNGITIIERALRILDSKNLSKIVIVVGYKAQKLMAFIDSLNIHTPIHYIENEVYMNTNNIYSLALAKQYLCEEDTLLLESDIVFEEAIIDVLLNDGRSTLVLVDKYESWMDGTCLELDENDVITEFVPGKYFDHRSKNRYYKTVNIYKFSKQFSENIYVPFLVAYEKAMGENEYYESVIKMIALLETQELRAKRLNGQKWYEIDNIQDLNIAESIFVNNDNELYDKISHRYGGYWRYPKMLDFCYLVNPYFPSQKMKDEMVSNFDSLVTQYPSGLDVNILLAAGFFGVSTKKIVIGNGAAELINCLMRRLEGNIGCVFPTFEEYPNRSDRRRVIPFKPSRDGYRYNSMDIINFYKEKDVQNLVLINPDNPSGNYIPFNELNNVIRWCQEEGKNIIIDESFVDFADIDSKTKIDEISIIKDPILNKYRNLIVIKSLSKSYGIPGVRLGVLATGNEDIINEIKEDISIWNINSFAEFSLQIMEKYYKDYLNSISKIRKCRSILMKKLAEIEYIKPYESNANYIMCKLNGVSSKELCCRLLKRNIFVKDLSKKINDGNEYIRIAVRGEEDNQILINVLQELFDKTI